MARFADRAVGAAVAPFERGATPVQRVLGVLLLVCVVSLLVSFYLTTKGNASENAEKYAGLEACSDAARDGCVELRTGDLEYDRLRGSQRAMRTSLFVPEGVRETDALRVSVPFGDVARPVEGMYLEGEFVGIQDADGERYPAREIDAPPSYWLGLAASALAMFVVWVVLLILHSTNAPASEYGGRRRSR